jgi:hypothetical protein
VCDAAAAHAKNAIKRAQQDRDMYINSSEEMATEINQVSGHIAQIVEMKHHKQNDRKMVGIRSHHTFKFTPIWIKGYTLAKDPTPHKKFRVKSYLIKYILHINTH